MTRWLRAAVLAGAAGAALLGASSSWAAYSPKLVVKAAANGQAQVTASVGASDSATARAQIYVPSGYTVATGAAVGSNLGAVAAQASAADLNNQILTLTGNLVVIAPNAAAQQACGLAAVSATWDFHLSAAGQTLDIPVFVVTNTGDEAKVAPIKLVVCLTSPDLPNGNPLRAPFGAKLISATFTSSAITAPTSQGEYRWTSLWTPYTPGTGNADLAGTVEAQALVEQPATAAVSVKRVRHARTTTVRVKGKKVKRTTVTTTVTVTTKVTEGRDAAPGAKVVTKVNGRSIGTKTTGSNGVAVQTFTLARGRAAISVLATIPNRDLGQAGCQATAALGVAAFGAAPCVDATESGGTASAATSVTAYDK